MSKATSFPAHQSASSKYFSLIFILIFAIPIGIILYLSLEGPLIFSVLMFSVLLGVLSLLTYFALAGGSTRYEVSSKSLRINFGLLKKTIPYPRIAKAEIVDLSITLRLFGASLPGVHIGLFRTSIGNVHAYATKLSGTFVVLTLADGQKYALSPEEPQGLLNMIEQKRSFFGTQSLAEIAQKEKSLSRLVYIQVLAVTAVYIAYMGYFIWAYLSLPQIIPLHFGFDGVPNRFGDKSELVWVAGIAGIFPVINAVLSLKFGKHERGFVIALGAIFLAVMATFFAVTYYTVSMV
ncbi:MAG: PH domain-containing protein [Candidatus Bathyarchaeia archaeon]|jgi:hypothetical protein